MCDALLPPDLKPCPRPGAFTLTVEASGEVLSLCAKHAHDYDDEGEAIRYVPKPYRKR